MQQLNLPVVLSPTRLQVDQLLKVNQVRVEQLLSHQLLGLWLAQYVPFVMKCPHTFHARCLNEWREVTGVPDHHCPYRCHESNQNVEQAVVTTAAENGVSDEAGDSAGDVAEEPVAFM